MKIDAKSALLQPLLDDIRAISLKHQTLLSSFSLKISLKSTLSNHDQVVDILVSEFNVPIEVVENVFSYLPLTYLVNFLGASFDQAMHYSKNCTFESVKQELEDAEDAHSYMINHAGQVHLLKFRNLLLKNANTGFYFKNEIVQFLLNEDIEDKEDGVKYHAVSYISKYNRLDLCEIVYSETELFNRIHDSLDLAAEFGNLEVVEFLTRKGVSCSTNAMDFGATNGHLHVIQWLHENRFEGCSAKAMSLAAGCGHLDVVQWLHKNRSERCSSYAIIDAASNSHIEVVKYLIENGIVSDQNSFRFSMNVAKKQGKTEIVSYLESVLK